MMDRTILMLFRPIIPASGRQLRPEDTEADGEADAEDDSVSNPDCSISFNWELQSFISFTIEPHSKKSCFI